ncbi:DUF6470 family protein [Lacrimispora saccharolytica]|uniref:Uncharacterized protein n=1 Tax=Lacrimispora saccharolytica (strain ATCC 35040 / DSM 2544 / NRCC 2533 / WM1) TaxID=610130 RepID=D9R9Y5_LACSW|nr:DUF6470 family protein [Lacrimispora saccharolytica]ADL05957.1 hypothetical protein Closa_3431 [[Clostridium] saccharolyticum WM1]QRV19913.1 hypothetical protein I6K70_21295 [Lacrimispora saccharolytica]
MEPLLRITTVPLKYELKIQKARLEYKRSTAELQMNRQKGEMSIENHPIKVSIDTYNARNSVCPTTMESVRQAASYGKAAAAEATANYAEEGALLLDPRISNPLDQIISQRAQMPSGDFGLQFLPNTGPDIEWSEPDLNIKYQMDKLSFELKVAKGDYEFIPGKVELSITQMPDVEIEYIGKPIYVPPSAANFFNHTPLDVLA